MLTYSTLQGVSAPTIKWAALAAAIHCACGYAQPQSTTSLAASSADTGGEMTVTAPHLPLQAGSKTSVSAEQMQKNGATDFGSVMRYQPLISATGVSGGSAAGKSGFDRSGYTGFNIRGLESNRVGIDIDGSPLPDATGRSYVGRPGLNTFGIGRDYIDPYMYGRVNIQAGASSADESNTSIGGTVSFRNKSPDDYLHPGKETWFGYQSDYDSSDRGWHNGITAAAGDSTLRGIVVLSRRDGQQTSNNSGTVAAYPANWHSTALMMSGIWQPNDRHRFSATLDDYHKTNHTRYDTWSGDSIIGDTRQQSDTRRWGLSLGDDYTPDSGWVDSLTTRIDYQHSEAHDTSLIPASRSQSYVYSDYNVDTWGVDTRATKTVGRHDLSAGLNARITDSERPFRQAPAPSVYSVIMQPQADSRSWMLGGYLQDRINFDLEGSSFAAIPALRMAYQNTRPQNLTSLTTGSTVLSESQLETLYGKANSDSQLLPSLTLEYSLTPTLLSYVQYQRGAQFPNASQLYGSWNLGASYAGTAQYALIGNSDLETETSNNLEWGLKGELSEGVSFSTALFYNSYKNFIANTRYTRSANPEKFTRVPSNIYTVYQAENRDKAFIWGGEVSTKINYGSWFTTLKGWSSSLAVGYAQGKSKSSYSGDSYVDLDSVPPMKAVLGVAWDDPAGHYGAAVTSTFVKGKKAEATGRESYSNSGIALSSGSTDYLRIAGYGLVDMTAYWRLSENVKLSGGIYNLTDAKYRDYLSSRQLTSTSNQDAYQQALAVMPGRTFQLGMNVEF